MEYYYVICLVIASLAAALEEEGGTYDPFNFHKKYFNSDNEAGVKTRVYSRHGKPIATLFVEPQYASHYIDSRHFVSPPQKTPDFVSLRDSSKVDYFPPKPSFIPPPQEYIPHIYEISSPEPPSTSTSTTTQRPQEAVVQKGISVQSPREDPARSVLKSWTSLDEEKPSWDDDDENVDEQFDPDPIREKKKTYGSWKGIDSGLGALRNYNESNWILVSKTNANED